MKLFIFVLFALFAIAFSTPIDSNPLKKVAEVGTGVVTVPGGAVTGGVGAFVGSGGDPSKTVEGAEFGAKQGAEVAKNSGR